MQSLFTKLYSSYLLLEDRTRFLETVLIVSGAGVIAILFVYIYI